MFIFGNITKIKYPFKKEMTKKKETRLRTNLAQQVRFHIHLQGWSPEFGSGGGVGNGRYFRVPSKVRVGTLSTYRVTHPYTSLTLKVDCVVPKKMLTIQNINISYG